MELKCLEVYGSAEISLVEGETTVGREVTEEKKAQMLEDYPEKFEIYEGVTVGKEEVTEAEVVAAEEVKTRKKGK